jgi:hypothetical protein
VAYLRHYSDIIMERLTITTNILSVLTVSWLRFELMIAQRRSTSALHWARTPGLSFVNRRLHNRVYKKLQLVPTLS